MELEEWRDLIDEVKVDLFGREDFKVVEAEVEKLRLRREDERRVLCILDEWIGCQPEELREKKLEVGSGWDSTR